MHPLRVALPLLICAAPAAALDLPARKPGPVGNEDGDGGRRDAGVGRCSTASMPRPTGR